MLKISITTLTEKKMNPEDAAHFCFRELVFTSKMPIIFSASIDWDILKWNIEDWSAAFQNKLLPFRCGRKICQKDPVWESQCEIEYHTFDELLTFSKEEALASGKWWYFDYKHISEHLPEFKNHFSTLSWAGLGFPDKNAEDSTIWIGSPGAHTSCHFDSYGCNIVAQVLGKKRWILFPPSETENLKPTRVPYEESSVYSCINFCCSAELEKNLKVNNYFVVDLNPGDVLLIPPKWWHFVENLSLSISINTWIPIKDDDISRLDEALVRYFVSCLIENGLDEMKKTLLNPNEHDLNVGTINLDIIKFCKERIAEVPDSITVEKYKENYCNRYHCHKYKFIRAIPATEFHNKLLKCSHSHGANYVAELSSDHHVDTLTSIINAFCHPDIICQVRNKILN